MSKKCKGCGVELQHNSPGKIGYTPKADSEYCQRCFRLTHYNDVTLNMQKDIDTDQLFKQIEQLDCLVLWVVDLFDFEGSVISGLNRHLQGKDIIMVATKRDLLPRTLSNYKIINFISERVKELGNEVKGVVVTTDLATGSKNENNHSIEEIEKAIDLYRHNRDVVVVGSANAGKSTLLNALLNQSDLTVSYHPGTSLDLNPIMMDGYTLYDTPGIVQKDSLLTYIDEKNLKDVIVFKEIKPKQFQLNEDQSISVSGLVRLDLKGCQKVSVVCYFSNNLLIHRSKMANADKLWNEHYGELLSVTLSDSFHEMKKYQTSQKEAKSDIVISGLGFLSVSGIFKEAIVYVDPKVGVTFRKAMI